MLTWLSTTGMAKAGATTPTARATTAKLVDLSDVDDEGSTREQLSEFPDGTFGSDGVCYTSEQWDQYEESFERHENDVQSLIESEIGSPDSCLTSEPDVAPSTIGGQRPPKRQDDHCPRGQQLRQHANQRVDVSFVVVLIWSVTVLIGTNRPGRVRKDRRTT